MLYSTTENNKEEIQEHEKKLIKEPQVSFHDHFRTLVKERKKKSELIYPILVSGVVMIIFSLIYYPTISLQPLLVIALVVGWSIFSLLTLISKHRITKGFWTLIGTKIYLILLVVSLVLTAYDYYQIHRDYDASFEDYVRQTLLGQEKIPTNGYIFTGEGTVL
jgi:multisubunit Na+/H+ antiporter MnhB subunit